MNISAWHSTPMAGWEALFASELSSSKPVCSARCPNILRLGQASLSCKMRFLLVSSPIVVTCCYYTALRRVLFYGSNMFQICWDNFKCFSLFGRSLHPTSGSSLFISKSMEVEAAKQWWYTEGMDMLMTAKQLWFFHTQRIEKYQPGINNP